MPEFTEEQSETLRDLLKEKSLTQIYIESRKIRFSKINIGVGLFFLVFAFGFATQAPKTGTLADLILSFATMAFSLSIGQLGFLLAGFSFFATVADKDLFAAMATKKHSKSGLSFLKHNFFTFMRVFCEYLVFAIACLVLMIVLSKGSGAREFISSWLETTPKLKHFLVSLTWGFVVGTTVYLVLQLASFIFNIFHVVMTSIRWQLEKTFEAANGQTNANSDPTQVPTDETQD
jgi:hypothetical protein